VSARPTAVVVGTVSLDLVADRPDAELARAAVGNSGANVAVRLAAAGWDVDLVSLVGSDGAGRAIREDLERWGVDTTGLVVRSGYRSPRVFQVGDGTDRGAASISSTCPHCHRPRGHRLEVPRPDELPDPVRERARRADLVLADVADDVSIELAAHATGRVWFEASLRESTVPAMRALAAQAHVVKVSAEDADHYAPAFDVLGPRSALHVVTEGSRGVRLRRAAVGGWPPGWDRLPSVLDAAPVDTIGAGDALTAAAAAAYGVGDDVLEALRAGGRAAAASCLHVGARGDMLPPGSAGSPWLPGARPFRCGLCDDSG
jgi:sugar/nucleoside kinase (ribokinase family)